MVELALFLPIAMGVMMLFLWMASAYFVKMSLRSAVFKGTYLAFTRGNYLNTDDGLQTIPFMYTRYSTSSLAPSDLTNIVLEDVYKYKQYGLVGIRNRPLHEMLVAGSEMTETLASNIYDNNTDAGWCSSSCNLTTSARIASLREANPVDILAIAYTQYDMKLSVGNMVKYPCAPSSIGDPSPAQKSGCLHCQIIGANLPTSTEVSRVQVKCSHQVSGVFSDMLYAFISPRNKSAAHGLILKENLARVE